MAIKYLIMDSLIEIGERRFPKSWIQMLDCDDKQCAISWNSKDSNGALVCNKEWCGIAGRDNITGDFGGRIKATTEYSDMKNIFDEKKYKFPSHYEFYTQKFN
jgi:hypothetical protein